MEIAFSIRLICADRVIVGEEGDDTQGHEQEVISDTLLVLLDFLAYFQQNHNQPYNVVTSATIDPFTERLNDRLAGNSVTIQIRQPFDWNKCQIPQTGASIPPSVDGLTLYNFCDPAVIARLTNEQVACLIAQYNEPCEDATITINSAPFASVVSGGSLNVPVIQNGNPVGSKVGSNWVIPPCADGTVNITNTDSDPIASVTVASGGVEPYVIPNVSWTDSDGSSESTPYGDAIVCTPPTEGWTRPSAWIAIPDLTSADERLYGVLAVIENEYNSIAWNITTGAAQIATGDGTTYNSNGGVQSHVYNYSALGGSVNALPDGRNYKQVLVDITRIGGAILTVNLCPFTTVARDTMNNFLDINCSFPSATTLQFSVDPIASAGRRTLLLQRLRIWNLAANYATMTNFILYLHGLRSLELPWSRFGNVTFLLTSNRGVVDVFPSFSTSATVLQSALSAFNIRQVGDITAASCTSTQSMYSASQVTKVGTFTGASVTNATAMYQGTYLLTGEVRLSMASLITATNMFNGSSVASVVFISSCAAITTTTTMFFLASNLNNCVMPNLTRGVSFVNTSMGNYGMSNFANSIGTASGTQNITVTGTPFGQLLAAADATAVAIAAVITGKGYGIIN
jgi:hypothetical protein